MDSSQRTERTLTFEDTVYGGNAEEKPDSLTGDIFKSESQDADVFGQKDSELLHSVSITSQISVELKETPPQSNKLKLKVFVSILACIMVVGVVLIYHFYNLKEYYLEVGKTLDFDEIARTLEIYDENGNKVLNGYLGLNISPGKIPYVCEAEGSYKEKSCIGWKDQARVYVSYNKSDHVNCYHISWVTESLSRYPYDCYDFGDAHWYGGFLPMTDSLQNLHFEMQPFLSATPNEIGGFGPVIEPTWLTTKSVGIYVEGDPPLHLSVNANSTSGQICLMSRYEKSPYHNPTDKMPWLNYTICTAPDIRAMHQYLLQRMTYLNNPGPIKPPTSKFTQVLYSTWPRFKQNINQQQLLDYVDNIVADHMAKGVVMIQEGWQSQHGDLTFNTDKFPNSTDMIAQIKNRGFQVGVAVTNLVSTYSNAFKSRLRDSSLVKDAGGAAAGLVDFYIGPHTPSWHQDHSAAIAFSQEDEHSLSAEAIKEALQVDKVHFDGGQVELLPFYSTIGYPVDTPNQYTTYYVANVTDEDWCNVQAAYRCQGLDNFIQLYDANSTESRELNGYQGVLPQAITLGIMGYPFFVPSAIGGSNYPPTSSPTKSLYTRWAQMVTFFPVMQFGTLPDMYDQTTANHINSLTDTHKYEVLNAINEVLDAAHTQLHPIVRPLWWYDPLDPICINTHDQFMVGNRILVAPFFYPDHRSRSLYLPVGTWKDENTGEIVDGPATLQVNFTDIYAIPHYLRLDQNAKA